MSKDPYERSDIRFIVELVISFFIIGFILMGFIKYPRMAAACWATLFTVFLFIHKVKINFIVWARFKVALLCIVGIFITAINTNLQDHHTYSVKYPLLQLLEIPIIIYILSLIHKANNPYGESRSNNDPANPIASSPTQK